MIDMSVGELFELQMALDLVDALRLMNCPVTDEKSVYAQGWKAGRESCIDYICRFFGWTERDMRQAVEPVKHPSQEKSQEKKVDDPVNHPSHYTSGNIEVIDFLEDQKLSYHLGNAVKYICRAGKKDPAKEVEDLQKAVWYINRYIGYIRRDT